MAILSLQARNLYLFRQSQLNVSVMYFVLDDFCMIVYNVSKQLLSMSGLSLIFKGSHTGSESTRSTVTIRIANVSAVQRDDFSHFLQLREDTRTDKTEKTFQRQQNGVTSQ